MSVPRPYPFQSCLFVLGLLPFLPLTDSTTHKELRCLGHHGSLLYSRGSCILLCCREAGTWTSSGLVIRDPHFSVSFTDLTLGQCAPFPVASFSTCKVRLITFCLPCPAELCRADEIMHVKVLWNTWSSVAVIRVKPVDLSGTLHHFIYFSQHPFEIDVSNMALEEAGA